MAMYPCRTCKANSWTYEHSNETEMVTAKCGGCGVEVKFITKRGKRKAEFGLKVETKGTHAPDYKPIQHGPIDGEGAPW